MIKRLSSANSWEVILLSVGLSLLGLSGWQLVRYTAFQAKPEWFGVAEERSVPASSRKGHLASVTSTTPAALRILGRLEVPRLKLSVMVLEGEDESTLSLGPGHVPGTADPGAAGNSVIAGHRDFAFRALQKIRIGDTIKVESTQIYAYKVTALRIVKPDDMSVMRNSKDARLTLITCYPFRYLGDAPERYIVQARLSSAMN